MFLSYRKLIFMSRNLRMCVVLLSLLLCQNLHADEGTGVWAYIRAGLSDTFKQQYAYAYLCALTMPLGSYMYEKTVAEDAIDPLVMAFFHEQCAALGFEGGKNVKIKLSSECYAAGFCTMYIAPNWYKELVEYLTIRASMGDDCDTDDEKYVAVQKVLNIHAALMQHEINHLKNKDVRRNCLIKIAAACGLEAIHQGICVYRGKPLFQNSAEKSWSEILAASTIKTLVLAAIEICHRRWFEQRADDGIADDIPILQGAKSFIDWVYEKRRARLKEGDEELLAFFDAHPRFFALLDPIHPRDMVRSAKFQERIDALYMA